VNFIIKKVAEDVKFFAAFCFRDAHALTQVVLTVPLFTIYALAFTI
jgi:hypothetical protein